MLTPLLHLTEKCEEALCKVIDRVGSAGNPLYARFYKLESAYCEGHICDFGADLYHVVLSMKAWPPTPDTHHCVYNSEYET